MRHLFKKIAIVLSILIITLFSTTFNQANASTADDVGIHSCFWIFCWGSGGSPGGGAGGSGGGSGAF